MPGCCRPPGTIVDFWTLTERALDHAFARVPSVDKSLRPALLDAYFKLDAFPDARAALAALKAKGAKIAILSNGNPRMLDGAVGAAGIGDLLDAVLSVDAIRIYKPQPAVYAMVTDALQRRARGCRVRLVEPLGRDGRDCVRLPLRVGQPRRTCRTSIRNSRRSRSCAT